ncbi:MAG: class I SAM-dependent methyltransferase [Bacteroidetes bacterium]|nr:class I SAM-dependent methyltransferase [Bacteroidota bacterium]
MSFDKSYELHEKIKWDTYGTRSTEDNVASWKRRDTADYWRHERKYKNLLPLINNDKNATWLTVGDGRFGSDARFLEENGVDVLATDLNIEILQQSKDTGYIKKFEKANAENLQFADNSFDYVLCKESYHHFPRPMVALAEMCRVAKKGVILIEPQDQDIITRERIRKYPPQQLLWRSFVNFARTKFLGKAPIAVIGEIDREDFLPCYEEFGNYVYEVSKPELLKVCYGQNFDAIAFKDMNDHYISGGEFELANDNSPIYRALKRKIEEMDDFCKKGIQNYDYLVACIFKNMPADHVVADLKKSGFEFKKLTKNPHMK